MKNYLDLNSRKALFNILIFLLGIGIQNTISAQNNFTYSIGFITNFSNQNTVLATDTSPFTFTESKNCINLNTGISRYLKSSRDSFSLSCKIADTTKNLQFSLFPNPSASNYVTVKLLDNLNTPGLLLLKIISYTGKVYYTKNISASELLYGYKIYLPTLASGIYIVNITSDQGIYRADQKLIIIK